METNSKFKMRLGLFVATGIAILVIGIFYIGRQKHIFNQVFKLNTTYKNISGLQVGNNVRFSGINIGTVNAIEIINDSTVRVEIIVEREIQKFIKSDSYTRISSEGLIGDKAISIMQGSSTASTVKDNQYLPAVEPVETDAILASVKVSVANAEIVSTQLAEILYKVNNGNGTLARLIRDTVIATNISQTITNLKKGSKGLNENMEAAKHNFLFRGYFKKKEKEKEEKEKGLNNNKSEADKKQ